MAVGPCREGNIHTPKKKLRVIKTDRGERGDDKNEKKGSRLKKETTSSGFARIRSMIGAEGKARKAGGKTNKKKKIEIGEDWCAEGVKASSISTDAPDESRKGIPRNEKIRVLIAQPSKSVLNAKKGVGPPGEGGVGCERWGGWERRRVFKGLLEKSERSGSPTRCRRRRR